MKILAKSALRQGQPAARQSLPVDGIEILFLGGEVEQRQHTINKLTELADHFQVVAVEAPCVESGKVISPLAHDKILAAASQDYLKKCIDILNEVHFRTKREMYFQYQHSFEAFGPNGKPSREYHPSLIPHLAAFHQQLKRNSNIPLQVENGTPIGIRQGVPAYVPVTARLHDFVQAGLPIALDITHLAITLYSFSCARSKSNGLFLLGSPVGSLYIEMNRQDQEKGARIRSSSSIQEAITSEVIHQIHQYKPFIQSLQFSNAKAGVGTDDADEGYAGTDGLLNIPRVFQEAILPLNIPYVIPEYTEQNYNRPVNQQLAIEMVRRLMSKD